MCRVTFCILAGGKSSRFESDKRVAKLKEKKVIEYPLSLSMQLSNNEVVISGKKEENLKLNSKIIEDDERFEGPLCGIEKVMRSIESNIYIFLAADMPFITKKMILNILDCLKKYETCLFSCKEKIYPLPFGTKKESKKFFKAKECKNRKIKEFLFFGDYRIIPWENCDNFFNINTKEDLKKAEELLLKIRLDF